MLYLVIIFVGMILVSLFNILLNQALSWHYIVIATILFTIASVIIDGLVALVIRKLPSSLINGDSKFFNVSKKELRFYEKIGIKKWKEKVPELGGFTSFHKNKISDPHNSEYLERFVLEVNYGILIHFVSIFTSFLIIFIDYKMFLGSNVWLTIGLPVSIINAILIGLPTCILRYNLPRLKMLIKINKRGNKNESK